jgi:hypothetical protein
MLEVSLGFGRLGSENRLFGAGESAASCGNDFTMFGAGRFAPPPVSSLVPGFPAASRFFTPGKGRSEPEIVGPAADIGGFREKSTRPEPRGIHQFGKAGSRRKDDSRKRPDFSMPFIFSTIRI